MSLLDFDVSDLFADTGVLDWSELEKLQSQLEVCIQSVVADRSSARLPFLDLPEANPSKIQELADTSRQRFDRLVVLGIGGSTLGARAVIEAFTGRRSGRGTDGTERRSVWFHESVDPNELVDLLEAVDWERTQWNVISKSGTTIETMSVFMVVWDQLVQRFGEEAAAARMVVTTDPEQGSLLAMAREKNLARLEVPPGVGGRFSVLTPVGLYPIAFAGIGVAEILAGAAQARDRSLSPDPFDNPAAILAATQILHYHAGRRIMVFMPYATALLSLAEWFCQLWAESLGKRKGDLEIGPTPIAALGVRDQHSQLQLYMDGPKDKNILFIEVSEFKHCLEVPISTDISPGVQHLCGKDLGEILRAELAGTRQALEEQGCPTSTIRVGSLSPESMGALLMLFEVSTALAAGLLDVGAYDQPGVELGKLYAHGLLGRAKESHYAENLQKALSTRQLRTIPI